jgi:hypothetical protein
MRIGLLIKRKLNVYWKFYDEFDFSLLFIYRLTGFGIETNQKSNLMD